MLDVAGQNADEFFEDIGHSKEARSELTKYLIGTYKMTAAEKAAMEAAAEAKSKSGSSMGIIMLVALIAIAVAYFKLK